MTRPNALVVGAASGIGFAIAQKLHADGWYVAGLDRNPVPDGPCTVVKQADVRDEEAIRSAVNIILDDLEYLTSLVYSAGISGSSVGDGPIPDVTGEAFDEVIDINLRGAAYVTSAAWPALVKSRGNVVLMSSVLGLTGGGGPFRSHSYIMSKGGLLTMTRALATEGLTAGVRVNCVAPGVVDTPLARRARTDPDVASYVAQHQPLTCGPISPEAIADAAAFLCSPSAAAITGQVLAVDAGWGLGIA